MSGKKRPLFIASSRRHKETVIQAPESLLKILELIMFQGHKLNSHCPRQDVQGNLPIYGASSKAEAIAIHVSKCKWLSKALEKAEIKIEEFFGADAVLTIGWRVGGCIWTGCQGHIHTTETTPVKVFIEGKKKYVWVALSELS